MVYTRSRTPAMESPDRIPRLRELEARVRTLTRRYEQLKLERDDLERRLTERDDQIGELKVELKELKKSREAVRKRIDGLLGDLARVRM